MGNLARFGIIYFFLTPLIERILRKWDFIYLVLLLFLLPDFPFDSRLYLLSRFDDEYSKWRIN